MLTALGVGRRQTPLVCYQMPTPIKIKTYLRCSMMSHIATGQ